MAPRRTELGLAHDKHSEFNRWPIASLRVLRALGAGDPMDTYEIMEASEILGEKITYPATRAGIVFLAYGPMWMRGCWDAFAENDASTTWLNQRGKELAALSLKIYPPRQRIEPEIESLPPDPITPLWRVLSDTSETLVIAASVTDAIAIYETQTHREAYRAIAVDTSAPCVLGWSERKGKPRAT